MTTKTPKKKTSKTDDRRLVLRGGNVAVRSEGVEYHATKDKTLEQLVEMMRGRSHDEALLPVLEKCESIQFSLELDLNPYTNEPFSLTTSHRIVVYAETAPEDRDIVEAFWPIWLQRFNWQEHTLHGVLIRERFRACTEVHSNTENAFAYVPPTTEATAPKTRAQEILQAFGIDFDAPTIDPMLEAALEVVHAAMAPGNRALDGVTRSSIRLIIKAALEHRLQSPLASAAPPVPKSQQN